MKKTTSLSIPVGKNFFFIRILPHRGTQMAQRYAHLSDKALEASAIVSSAVEKGSKKT
jgi:hypothetical protein